MRATVDTIDPKKDSLAEVFPIKTIVILSLHATNYEDMDAQDTQDAKGVAREPTPTSPYPAYPCESPIATHDAAFGLTSVSQRSFAQSWRCLNPRSTSS